MLEIVSFIIIIIIIIIIIEYIIFWKPVRITSAVGWLTSLSFKSTLIFSSRVFVRASSSFHRFASTLGETLLSPSKQHFQ